MRLPPLNALRAFEAAARHGGFTGAADELCVTRGAISRHVKLLEEHLGVALFRRFPQGVEMTEAGRRFLPVLSDAFESISQRALQIAAENNDLRIICPPTVSIRWLIPKLAEFHDLYPEIQTRLTTAFYDWDDLRSGAFEVGIACDPPDTWPPDVDVSPMFPMITVPACAPGLLDGQHSLKQPADLARFTLLHESPGHDDWVEWLDAFKVEGVDPSSGEDFPNLDIAVKAAVMGRGVVMGDLILTRDEFETGQLVMPFGNMVHKTDHDFAVYVHETYRDDPKVHAFKAWISQVASVDDEYCSQHSRPESAITPRD